MTITVEGLPVQKGETLFYPRVGKKTVYHTCQVLDTNEHVKAVKVSYCPGIKSGMRSDWFPASTLRRTQPEPQPAQPVCHAGQKTT